VDLSVVIVNWNTKDFLLRCLESVRQTVKGMEVEVFVVDNGSTDGSGGAVKERFPEIGLIENEMNLGFARGNNQALSRAAGKYLFLLNSDTQVKKGAIERLVSFMNAHPEVGMVGGQLLNSDGSKQNSIANFPSLATELLNKNLLRWLFPGRFPGKERDYPEPVEVDSVIGAGMMVRRDAIEQVGLLDEDYFLFLEETDWCYRMKKGGYKIYHVPQAEIYHFQGRSAEREKKRARAEYYRSRYHFFKKNGGSLQWSILLMGLIVRLSAELIFMSVACLFTFFLIDRWKSKLSLYAYLLWWHLRFCPKEMGLTQ
jgi:GT2 family glycosyltransferase